MWREHPLRSLYRDTGCCYHIIYYVFAGTQTKYGVMFDTLLNSFIYIFTYEADKLDAMFTYLWAPF